MDYQPMQFVYKPATDPDAMTLLLLDGAGGSEQQLRPLVKRFGNDFNVLVLRGNVSENEMPSFFKKPGKGVIDEKDLEFRTNEMVTFIKELAAKEKFDVTKIIALGYSNGANIAGSTLVLYPNFFAAAILFRPTVPFKNMQMAMNNSSTPLFLSSGKDDTTVNHNETEKYMILLRDAGFDVTDVVINADHNLHQADIDLAIDWFKNINI